VVWDRVADLGVFPLHHTGGVYGSDSFGGEPEPLSEAMLDHILALAKKLPRKVRAQP
jgi:hypothetical protein